MFKKIPGKKSFNKTIWFAFKKLLKIWNPKLVDVCTGALPEEIKALKFFFTEFEIQLYSHLRVMAAFNCHDTVTERSQHQLLTRKTSKWTQYYF